MASPPCKKASPSRWTDRISGLTDDVLGHVFSFLPTKEAACAAALARRWRHIFGSVHTISFEEAEGERESDWITHYYRSEERKSCSDKLLDGMSAALISRRRCPGLAVPLRNLRFAFDKWHWWDKVAVDQWLAYVLPPPRSHRSSHLELHLDLRFRIGPICVPNNGNGREVGSDSDDDQCQTRWRYLVPRRLFSCAAIRTLRLSCCRLGLPEVPIDLPFLETLHLIGLGDSGRSIQRLISSCPRLGDLTLEALSKLKSLSLAGKHLHRFAIRCCHSVYSIRIHASTKLRFFEYRGEAPAKSLLSLHGSPVTIIPSFTIDLCKAPYDSAGFDGLTSFLDKISATKHLHLHHHNFESGFFATALPLFANLTRLTLQGCVCTCYAVVVVGRILEQTPCLEVLSLMMKKTEEDYAARRHFYRNVANENRVPNEITVPDKLNFSIPCLQSRLREMGIQDYDGCEPQRMLVKLLLRNTLVLERLHVKFAEGLSSKRKRELEVRMGRWEAANFRKDFHLIS